MPGCGVRHRMSFDQPIPARYAMQLVLREDDNSNKCQHCVRKQRHNMHCRCLINQTFKILLSAIGCYTRGVCNTETLSDLHAERVALQTLDWNASAPLPRQLLQMSSTSMLCSCALVTHSGCAGCCHSKAAVHNFQRSATLCVVLCW